MIRVTGSTNLADCRVKSDSPLTNTLQLILVSGFISIDFMDAIFQTSSQHIAVKRSKEG